MYAVIKTGGKQYRVSPGEEVQVEKMPGEVGDPVTFDRVIMTSDGEQAQVGRPYLDKTEVVGRITRQGRHRKIMVFKFKRRKGYRKTRGHRQDFEYSPTYASVVKFKNGTIGRTGASLEVTCPYFFNIVIHGSKGSILNEKFFTKEFFAGQEGYQSFNCTLINSGEVTHHPFTATIKAFMDDIDHGHDSRIRLDFGIKVHEVAFALIKSAKTGQPVKLPLL